MLVGDWCLTPVFGHGHAEAGFEGAIGLVDGAEPGTGAMWNHDTLTAGNSLAAYQATIRAVDVKNGITSVGSQFFHKFYLVTNVTCAASMATVGDYTFFRCHSLEKMAFGGDIAFGEQSSRSRRAITV